MYDILTEGFETANEALAELIGGIGTDSPAEGLTDPDEVPEVDDDPITLTGDLIILGDHRLLCGDATKREDVDRLMDGQKADMVFTDPPYNVDYGASKKPRHKIRNIQNDSMDRDSWTAFCTDFILNLKEHCGGDVYMWGASGPEGMVQRLLLSELGCHWSATIVWKKDQLVLSPANYQRMYEPCFYGWFGKSSFVADRRQVEVWEIPRPKNSKLHPTMKPVDLCAYGIGNSSKPKATVMDIFGGSGSTLIACEQTNRKCYMMEIDPHYCDVIVKRWENFTGQEAERPIRTKGNHTP
jgi:DNA modification methylase